MKRGYGYGYYQGQQVIRGPWLVAVADGGDKVAMLATAQDLDLLIQGLMKLQPTTRQAMQKRKCYVEDLAILRRSAFPESK